VLGGVVAESLLLSFTVSQNLVFLFAKLSLYKFHLESSDIYSCSVVDTLHIAASNRCALDVNSVWVADNLGRCHI
jgi:hypothetical protein